MSPKQFLEMRTILKRMNECRNRLNELQAKAEKYKGTINDAEESLIAAIDLLKDIEEGWL